MQVYMTFRVYVFSLPQSVTCIYKSNRSNAGMFTVNPPAWNTEDTIEKAALML